MQFSQECRVPQALANNNFQGYAHQFIVENKVRWIEAVAACPILTSLVVYYIEGEKHHLVQTELGQQERTHAVRGNVFSFLMPWEEIQMHMHELVSDEEMATWPLPPALLTQVVRLVVKSGSSPMLEKVKELKVRAHVLLGLGRMYIERGHHDCLGTTAALMHKTPAIQ